jgi:hypothetical protein
MTTIRPNKQGVFPRLSNGVHDVALGNGTQFRIVLHKTGYVVTVGIVTRGCYEFACRADAGYVADKLFLAPFDGDAANIADLINDQMYEPGSIERQGHYSESLCAK